MASEYQRKRNTDVKKRTPAGSPKPTILFARRLTGYRSPLFLSLGLRPNSKRKRDTETDEPRILKRLRYRSFEKWARVIGGVLEFAGIEGFDPTHTQLSDTDMEQRQFVAVLLGRYGENPFTSRLLVEEMQDALDGLVDLEAKNPSQRVGYLLKRLAGNVFTEDGESFRLMKQRGRRPIEYRFEPLEALETASESTVFEDEVPF